MYIIIAFVTYFIELYHINNKIILCKVLFILILFLKTLSYLVILQIYNYKNVDFIK